MDKIFYVMCILWNSQLLQAIVLGIFKKYWKCLHWDYASRRMTEPATLGLWDQRSLFTCMPQKCFCAVAGLSGDKKKKKSWTEKRMMIFGRWEGIRSVLYGLTLAAKQSSFTVIRGRQRIWTPMLTAVDVVPGPLWGIFCLLLFSPWNWE